MVRDIFRNTEFKAYLTIFSRVGGIDRDSAYRYLRRIWKGFPVLQLPGGFDNNNDRLCYG